MIPKHFIQALKKQPVKHTSPTSSKKVNTILQERQVDASQDESHGLHLSLSSESEELPNELQDIQDAKKDKENCTQSSEVKNRQNGHSEVT